MSTSTVTVILDPKKLDSIEKDLTAFIDNNSQNPFLSYPFIKYLIQKLPSDSKPLILIVRVNVKIVGFVALKLNVHFGLRFVNSLLKPTGSPDIVAITEYRQEVNRQILTFLLKNYRCTSINLLLPVESENLQILEQECKKESVFFSKLFDPLDNHCIIRIDRSWADYQKLLSRKYRAALTNAERQLTSLGKWKIEVAQISEESQVVDDTIDKIHQIESESWKEEWRLQNGQTFDQDLEGILKTAYQMVRTNSFLKTYVWILQIHDKPVAYALVLCYKETAIIAKTSYSKKVAKASPGIFIMNAAISELFSNCEIQTIDFLTALPFLQKWHPIVLSRVKFKILPKKVALFHFIAKKLIEEMPIVKLSLVRWFLKRVLNAKWL